MPQLDSSWQYQFDHASQAKLAQWAGVSRPRWGSVASRPRSAHSHPDLGAKRRASVASADVLLLSPREFWQASFLQAANGAPLKSPQPDEVLRHKAHAYLQTVHSERLKARVHALMSSLRASKGSTAQVRRGTPRRDVEEARQARQAARLEAARRLARERQTKANMAARKVLAQRVVSAPSERPRPAQRQTSALPPAISAGDQEKERRRRERIRERIRRFRAEQEVKEQAIVDEILAQEAANEERKRRHMLVVKEKAERLRREKQAALTALREQLYQQGDL